MEGRPRPGQLVVIASGKGGVGKTNFALNLGIQLARRGARTILLDADFGHADSDILLNITPQADLTCLLDPLRPLSAALTPGPEGLHLLCGISGLRHEPALCEADPAMFLPALRRLRRACDVLLVDCAAGARGAAASFALVCDRLLLVTTPEPTAITDSYAALKLLCHAGFCARAAVVVNMVRSRGEGSDTARRLQRVAWQFLGLSVESWGNVPYDRRVTAAVRRRVPFVVRYPRCAASVALEGLADRLFAPPPVGRETPGIWSRVASLFF